MLLWVRENTSPSLWAQMQCNILLPFIFSVPRLEDVSTASWNYPCLSQFHLQRLPTSSFKFLSLVLVFACWPNCLWPYNTSSLSLIDPQEMHLLICYISSRGLNGHWCRHGRYQTALQCIFPFCLLELDHWLIPQFLWFLQSSLALALENVQNFGLICFKMRVCGFVINSETFRRDYCWVTLICLVWRWRWLVLGRNNQLVIWKKPSDFLEYKYILDFSKNWIPL